MPKTLAALLAAALALAARGEDLVVWHAHRGGEKAAFEKMVAAREMLRVRKSSPLVRLATAAEVMKRVDFVPVDAAAAPGVIVMTITDGTDASCGTALADLDPARDALVVVVNADVSSHTVTVPGASGFTLHAILASSADPVVRTATAAATSFTLPARTTAVFEQLQGASQGTGLPCNTR